MKYNRFVVVVAVFLITTFLLLVLLFSPFSHLDWKSMASTFASSPNTDLSSTSISHENSLLGTKKWLSNLDKGPSLFIQAYANASSISPGQNLAFFVSTHAEKTRYTLSLYRLGWYNGDGARLMLYTSFLPGHAQGYYDSSQHTLINCHSCLVNMTTGLIDANWRSSYSLQVPPDWTTGVYLAKFTDEQNNTAVVPFDVRGNSHARYVVVTPDTSYQAYNTWGGFSLFTSTASPAQHAVQVSFNRPYLSSQDTSQLFDSELNAIRWLEMQGYDLSYISAVDLHEHPRLLLDHRAYLSLGQDSFWTKEMRDGVEYARDHGVGLAFLGAQTATWQMRFQPDHLAHADRTIVSYRVSSSSHNLHFDPSYHLDPSRVTTQWRDPFLSRPENALLGIMSSGSTPRPTNFFWHVDPHASSSFFSSTGLTPNKDYGCALVGNVWDRVFNNGATPPGLSILATSKTFNANNQPDVSNTTSYIAPSGALVFATGSLYWNRGLDSFRFHPDPQCPPQDKAVPEIQRLFANIMDSLIIPHKPPQVTQTGHVLPLITTPYAVNQPAASAQGNFIWDRRNPLSGRQFPSQSQKKGDSISISVSTSPSSNIHSISGKRIGGQTSPSSQSSVQDTLGSFRGGRHGRRVHIAINNSLPSAQSTYERSTQINPTLSQIRSRVNHLLSNCRTSSCRYILTRFFGNLKLNR